VERLMIGSLGPGTRSATPGRLYVERAGGMHCDTRGIRRLARFGHRPTGGLDTIVYSGNPCQRTHLAKEPTS